MHMQNELMHMLLFQIWLLILQTTSAIGTSDSSVKNSDQEQQRTGRAWHHPASAPQHKQIQPAVFIPTSTNQPGDSAVGSDPGGAGRNFEEQDKTAVPAASEQDFLSRHFGYMNVHRFDPNLPYYDRQQYPRYPSPHSPRFGPGYRKDKYGHGYGYSCKHGDDCDEVRAANLIPHVPPPHPHVPPHHLPLPHHNSPPTPYNSAFVDVAAFSNIPPYPGHPSFPPFSAGGIYPQGPARFSDPHLSSPHQMSPSRFYHGRYLHDQDESHGKDGVNKQTSLDSEAEWPAPTHTEHGKSEVST